MTINQIIDDVQHQIHASKCSDGEWAAWIDPVPNPTMGATRFPIEFNAFGATRGQAIKKLYEELKGAGNLVKLKSKEQK